MLKSRSLLLFLLVIALFQHSCAFLRDPGTSPSSQSGGSNARLRKEIVNDAENFLGSEYQYAGRDPKTGFDCSGFTSYVLGRHGIKVSTSSAAQSEQGRKIPVESTQPGDLVFFKDTNGKIQHVALVVKNSREGIFCIHSTTSRGVIVDNISTSNYWKPRIWIARDVITRP